MLFIQAKTYQGRILVCKEISQDTFTGHLEYVWETIANDSDVLTPSEVYDSLKEGGYVVNYHRLPVTEGTPPAVSYPSWRRNEVIATAPFLKIC